MMPFGHGTVNWDAVIRALKRIGYTGLFNLEIPGETRCPIPVRLAKLDYLKSMLALMLDFSQLSRGGQRADRSRLEPEE